MLIQRIAGREQVTDSYVDSLLSMAKDNPGSCDEVWFASLYGYPPLEKHRELAGKILRQAEKLRRAGLRASLQISNTIGHGEYISKFDCSGLVYPDSLVCNLVGFDGTVARHCFCWRDRFFKDYILESIRAYLPLRPDVIWFDDDFRPNHHTPIAYGCFCDDCVAAFGQQVGRSFTREELVRELNGDDLALRRAFIEFTKAGLVDFMTECCEVIHRELPDTRVGLQQGSMNGFIGDSGNYYLYETIYRVTGHPALSRPGGGVYTDHDPRAFIQKGNEIERQNRECPPEVVDFLPEIESLPYVAYGKSATGTCFETTLYLALGASGMTYAMMMDPNEADDFYRREFELFSQHRPYWEKLSATNARSVQSGVNSVYPDARWQLKSDIPFAYAENDQSEERILRFIGLPISYRRNTDGAQILHGSDADRISDETIRQMLRKPLITDAETIEKLTARGYTFDISVERIDTLRLREACTDHEINRNVPPLNRTWTGRFAGKREGYRIIAKGEGVEAIGKYIGASENAGELATVVFTTEFGAKWAVFGFDIWNRIVSLSRRDQILSVVSYISGRDFDAEMIDGFSSLVLPRVYPSGALASVSIVNCTPGESGEYRLRTSAPEGKAAHYMTQYGRTAELTVGKDGVLVMPSLASYNVGTVFFEE